MTWTPFISGYVSIYFCQVNPNTHKAGRTGGGGGGGGGDNCQLSRPTFGTFKTTFSILTFFSRSWKKRMNDFDRHH